MAGVERYGNYGLLDFYLIYHAWSDLEDFGHNYYFDGATLENIEEVTQQRAQEWLNVHILKIPQAAPKKEINSEKALPSKEKKNTSMLSSLKKWFS